MRAPARENVKLSRPHDPPEATLVPTVHDHAANDNTDSYDTSLEMMQPILAACVDSACGPNATFAEREAMVLRVCNDSSRLKLERDLQKISDGLSEALLIKSYHRPGHLSAALHADWISYPLA
jgi:hypothetical protein